jgi:hypothetical protein
VPAIQPGGVVRMIARGGGPRSPGRHKLSHWADCDLYGR